MGSPSVVSCFVFANMCAQLWDISSHKHGKHPSCLLSKLCCSWISQKTTVAAGREFNWLLELRCAPLCARLLALNHKYRLLLKSIIAAAPVRQKCQRRLKKAAGFICVSFCFLFFFFLFFTRAGVNSGECMAKCRDHKWFEECISRWERDQHPVAFLYYLLSMYSLKIVFFIILLKLLSKRIMVWSSNYSVQFLFQSNATIWK